MSKKEKWVRRFEVNESAKHKNGFTIYKITSVLFPISSPEVLTIVSVWKRYSEAQRLHTAMRSLHAGLRLKGDCPGLPTHGYFKRFQPEVISERAGAIKCLLEFVAEHQLLFTSTDFVNFLQTGYPEPSPESTSKISNASISAIRASLHLPVVENAPLEYPTSDDDSSPMHKAQECPRSIDETDYSQIPIYHASDYDLDIQLPSKSNQQCTTLNTSQKMSKTDSKLSKSDSFESLNSLESISSDLYSELEKITVSPTKSAKKSVLPDLINFDVPSTSRFDDYHTMTRENAKNDSETQYFTTNTTKFDVNHCVTQKNDHEDQNIDLNTPKMTESASDSISLSTNTSKFEDDHTNMGKNDLETRNFNLKHTKNDHENPNIIQNTPKLTESLSDSVSLSSTTNTFDSTFRSSCRTSHSMVSLSNAEYLSCKTKTEDSYVFEAGYVLNLGARYEDVKDHQRAFECYKAGIEKMLVGVQADTDPKRIELIKQKTNKYLSYAENIYKNHLCGRDTSLSLDDEACHQDQSLPIWMLRRPYDDLALYKVLSVLTHRVMLTLHREDRCCYAMKVIQKIPNNLTEFDEYFLQNVNETRKPILPTLVPYMVPLISYIETENLIFLILNYAPGEKLVDYIKNYVKSSPSTPRRDVNLENVFTEPKMMKFGEDSIIEMDTKSFKDNEVLDSEIDNNNLNAENVAIINESFRINNENTNIINNTDISVSELVRNSKTLIQNVEKVLNEVNTPQCEKKREGRSEMKESNRDDNITIEMRKEKVDEKRNESLLSNYKPSKPLGFPRDVIPPSTICQWGAEILTAIESLHNCGVVCRDLHPSNILLGDRGQVCLTYMVGYSLNSVLATLRLHRANSYRAPELSDLYYCLRFNEEHGLELEKLCDYWSFGAIMYELLCGVPLHQYHTSGFTSHTIVRLPDGLPVEAQSFLTQLLTYSPASRLGAGQEGVGEIKSHPYFKHIDWRHVYDSWTLKCHHC